MGKWWGYHAVSESQFCQQVDTAPLWCPPLTWSVSVCVCVYIHVCVYTCLCVCTCLCVYMSVGVHVCIYMSVYTCLCVYMSVCTCLCIYMSVYTCLCVYMSVCTCLCVYRPVLFQSTECLASSDVIGDVIPYSIALHLLYTRAHPDIKPPYQVSLPLYRYLYSYHYRYHLSESTSYRLRRLKQLETLNSLIRSLNTLLFLHLVFCKLTCLLFAGCAAGPVCMTRS